MPTVMHAGSRPTRAQYVPFANVPVRNGLQAAIEVPALVRGLRLPTGGRVLEIGCGRGIALPVLRQLLRPVLLVGLDVDPALVVIAREAVPRGGCDVMQGDAQRLPFADASFDMIIDFGTAYHVPDALALLREVARVLSPGGLFVHETPVSQHLAHPVRSFARRLPWSLVPSLAPVARPSYGPSGASSQQHRVASSRRRPRAHACSWGTHETHHTRRAGAAHRRRRGPLHLGRRLHHREVAVGRSGIRFDTDGHTQAGDRQLAGEGTPARWHNRPLSRWRDSAARQRLRQRARRPAVRPRAPRDAVGARFCAGQHCRHGELRHAHQPGHQYGAHGARLHRRHRPHGGWPGGAVRLVPHHLRRQCRHPGASGGGIRQSHLAALRGARHRYPARDAERGRRGSAGSAQRGAGNALHQPVRAAGGTARDRRDRGTRRARPAAGSRGIPHTHPHRRSSWPRSARDAGAHRRRELRDRAGHDGGRERRRTKRLHRTGGARATRRPRRGGGDAPAQQPAQHRAPV